MSNLIQLRVGLKVVDLVAQTAWITLKEKLGYGDELAGLKRYSYWEMETGEDEGILDEVEKAITMDSTFTNQNKHFYSLIMTNQEKDSICRSNLPPGGGLSGNDRPGSGNSGNIDESSGREDETGCYTVDCLIRERDVSREEGYTGRLNGKLGSGRVKVKLAGEVWSIKVKAQDRKQATGLAEDILITRSRQKGLLINPHYQVYEILRICRESGGGERIE